jgi:hypothetical protein
MASLKATISLNTTDAASDTLKLNSTVELTTTVPAVNIGRVEVSTAAATNLLTAAGNTNITYVYLKNTATDSSHILIVKDDAGNAFSDLGSGESMFLPVKGGVGLECQASGADITAEYGYWTKG